jgi:PilZ domain
MDVMLPQIINSVWLVAIIGSALVLAIGTWIFLALRNRSLQAKSAQELLYRDPALWVRSLPVSPFPHKNPENGNGAKPVSEPVSVAKKPTPAKRPLRTSALTPTPPSPVRYGRENRDLREKRCSLRRQGNPTTVQIADGSVKELSGWVVDRSTTGLCVACPEDLEIGSTISIRSTHYGDSGPWVLAQVKRCEPADKGWIIGFSFTDPLPWNVLLRFG